MHLSNEAAGIATQTIPIKGTALEDTCQEEPVCPDLKYRTLDGSCNNLQSPNMGRSVTQLGRYLAPQYDDGALTCLLLLLEALWPSCFVSGRW